MENLFNLEDFNEEKVVELVKLALRFKSKEFYYDFNFEKILALLFFEPSTRTSYSFYVAAQRLKIQVINFAPETSSLKKGERFEDTVKTFESFDIDGLVIRDRQNDYYKNLEHINIPIINGGDGSGAHPTQSLLDLMTIYEIFGKFSGLNILITGDIKHSRVARTNYKIMKKLGMNIMFSAIEDFHDDYGEYVDLDKSLPNVDIVMLLRAQLERHAKTYNIKEYNEQYGLNENRLKLLKENSIIMHPAPFNMNVELTKEVLEDRRCKIFDQSNNGVYMRMAVLYEIFK